MIFWVVFWFLILVALAFIEALTYDLLTIWFMPSAVVCLILAALTVPLYIQLIVFFALSAILVVLYKTVLKKYFEGKQKSKTNIDLIIGETGVVQETINNIVGTGSVKVKSQIWTARSTDDSVELQVGDYVEIVSIEGVKLICKKR